MKVNFVEKNIVVSRSKMSKASIIGSKEYSELIQLMRDLPEFKIVIKERSRVTNNHNGGLTYKVMEEYISQNAPEMLNEFYGFRQVFGYFRVTQWFRKTFPEY